MELTLPILKKMFDGAARDIAAEEQNLCRLDSACGDGDHGVAMRGAIEAASGAVQAASNLKDAFFDAGMAAMANSNGSTSTIYGTLFTGISDALPAGAESLSAAQIASAFEGALASMREVVKGDVGDQDLFRRPHSRGARNEGRSGRCGAFFRRGKSRRRRGEVYGKASGKVRQGAQSRGKIRWDSRPGGRLKRDYVCGVLAGVRKITLSFT